MHEWLKGKKDGIKVLSIFVGIIVPLLSLSFSGIQYIEASKRLTKQKSFENYHIVIERLSGGDRSDMYIATANIYELRNYPEYSEVSLRILEDMERNWVEGYNDALSKEILTTKEFLAALE